MDYGKPENMILTHGSNQNLKSIPLVLWRKFHKNFAKKYLNKNALNKKEQLFLLF